MLTTNIKKIETRYGEMSYYADDLFIGHSLEKYGEYSEGEPELWQKFLTEGDVVLDVGANIGALTLALAHIVGTSGTVIAFEPQPENYGLLKLNVEWCDNVFAEQVALGDCDGTIRVKTLSSLPDTNYGGFELGGDENDEEVRLATLDNFYKSERMIDFIKIDVEGMEVEVLKGAKKIISQYRPVLYVENDRERRSEELIQLLSGMDYRLYHHLPVLYSPRNFRGVPVSDRMIISVNLLCVPDECVPEFEKSHVVDNLAVVVPRSTRKVIGKRDWAGIVRVGGIGDNLIAAATFKQLKKQGFMIEVISEEPCCVVFENNPYVDKLTIKNSVKDIPQGNPIEWQKYWWGRSREYARFANLSHSVEVLLAQFPASTAFWWPAHMRRKMCKQSYLEAACDIVDVPYDFGPLFYPTADEKADIVDFKRRNKLDTKPLVCWIVGGTRVDKIYPWAGYAIARLISELDVNVVLLSAPSPMYRDAIFAERIVNHVTLTNSSTKGVFEIRDIKPEHNWPIRRMLTFAQMTDLVVGPDSGVMWAVAMEPVVGKILLHSHASVENITKHWQNTTSLAPTANVKCWPCHLLHDGAETCQEMQMQAGLEPKPDDPGAACISSITIERVLDAAKQHLRK